MVRSLLILIVLSFTTTSLVENIESQVLVDNFKNKGVYQEDISTDTIKYYKVSGDEVKYPDTSRLAYCPGFKGDIFCSRQQTTIAPVLNEFISFYVGGHAGYCGGNYRDYSFVSTDNTTIEASSTSGADTTCRLYNKSDWTTDQYFYEVIGLSVDMTEEEKDEVTSLIFSYKGDPYNGSFLFDTVNKTYCTDMLSKAFKYIGKDLNRDGFTTSVFDVILSPDTYITYYHYISNGVKYIYYLG